MEKVIPENPENARKSRKSSEESSIDIREMDFLFVEPPPDDLTCPICLHVQHEPVLTSCCGNHFCHSCVEQVRLEQRPCPLCNSHGFTTMLDKYFVRKVNELHVWCQYRKMGCPWQGSVCNLKRHLDSKSGNCKFIQIDCPYFCGTSYNLCELECHKKVCHHRPHTCKFCGYNGTYDGMRTKHWCVCDKYPLPCPNSCGQLDIPRQSLNEHLKECLQNITKCEFAYAGCTAHVKGSDMSEHLSSSLQEHLCLVSKHCLHLSKSLPMEFQSQMEEKMKSQDINIRFLQAKLKESEDEMSLLRDKVASMEDEIDDVKSDCLHLTSVVFVPPFEFIMTEFRKHKNESLQWLSPSFYSHIGGYKMCISVDANGSEEGQNTHVSVYINLMKGEYDEHLQWPFRGSIFMELCNQKSNADNWKEKIIFTYDTLDIASRVTEGILAEHGLGIPTFIEHSCLSSNLKKKNTEYLKNDCLRFKIQKVE